MKILTKNPILIGCGFSMAMAAIAVVLYQSRILPLGISEQRFKDSSGRSGAVHPSPSPRRDQVRHEVRSGRSEQLASMIDLWNNYYAEDMDSNVALSLIRQSFDELGCGDDLVHLIKHLESIGVHSSVIGYFGSIRFVNGPNYNEYLEQLRNSNYTDFPRDVLENWGKSIAWGLPEAEFEVFVDDVGLDRTDFSYILKTLLVSKGFADDPRAALLALMDQESLIENSGYKRDAAYLLMEIIRKVPENFDFESFESVIRDFSNRQDPLDRRSADAYREFIKKWSESSPWDATHYILTNNNISIDSLSHVGADLRPDRSTVEAIDSLIDSIPHPEDRDILIGSMVRGINYDRDLALSYALRISDPNLRTRAVAAIPESGELNSGR